MYTLISRIIYLFFTRKEIITNYELKTPEIIYRGFRVNRNVEMNNKSFKKSQIIYRGFKVNRNVEMSNKTIEKPQIIYRGFRVSDEN